MYREVDFEASPPPAPHSRAHRFRGPEPRARSREMHACEAVECKDTEAGHSDNDPPATPGQSDGRADINRTPSDLKGKSGQDEGSAILQKQGDHSRKSRSRSRHRRRNRDPCALTATTLAAWNCTHPAPRVRAYTPGGQQCCIEECIEGYEDMSFPGPTAVGFVLSTDEQWVQMATPEEKAKTGNWYKPLPFKPQAVVHSNGTVAFPHECLGAYGNMVTVLQQKLRLCQHKESASSQDRIDDVVVDEGELLDAVQTPKTPSSSTE